MDVKGWDMNTINNQDFDELSRIMSIGAKKDGKTPTFTKGGQKAMSMADFVTKGVDA
ncbi:MAG: hypothetical protein WBP82_03595 [Leuconostoc mesenteroides]